MDPHSWTCTHYAPVKRPRITFPKLNIGHILEVLAYLGPAFAVGELVAQLLEGGHPGQAARQLDVRQEQLAGQAQHAHAVQAGHHIPKRQRPLQTAEPPISATCRWFRIKNARMTTGGLVILVYYSVYSADFDAGMYRYVYDRSCDGAKGSSIKYVLDLGGWGSVEIGHCHPNTWGR